MKNMFKTQFAGLNLSNPLVIASSGLTNTVEKNKELEKAGVGAVILKSLFEEQISQKARKLLTGGDYPEANDYILNYLKTNEVNNYLKLIKETKETCRIPVIASVNCYKDDTWIDFAHQIEMAGADALELNIFALNTHLNEENDSLEKACIRITKKVKEAIHIPVIIKLGKYFSHLVKLVNDLDASGANGIVLFNRFYQHDIDINHLQVTSGHVFSSHTDICDTLRWTGIISGKLPGISIAASTGIYDWEAIIKCILSGASVVQLCSTIYQHGNEIISQIKRSMEEWMQISNFNSLDDFRGKLNYTYIEDPSLYERIQFMRYFSNWD